jgi:hypothetical protein
MAGQIGILRRKIQRNLQRSASLGGGGKSSFVDTYLERTISFMVLGVAIKRLRQRHLCLGRGGGVIRVTAWDPLE